MRSLRTGGSTTASCFARASWRTTLASFCSPSSALGGRPQGRVRSSRTPGARRSTLGGLGVGDGVWLVGLRSRRRTSAGLEHGTHRVEKLGGRERFGEVRRAARLERIATILGKTVGSRGD